MMPLLWLMVACGPREVRVDGTVFQGPELAEPGLGGATVETFDEDGEPWAIDVADDDGKFNVAAPRGQTIYATVTADGYATSSFTGQSGTEERLQIVESQDEATGHTLYGIRTEELEGWRALFADCPDLQEGGRAIVGEVRVFDIQDSVTDEHPIVTTASVKVVSATGVERVGCYLDPTGATYDPESTQTGDSGRFAVFGLEPGLATVEITYLAFDTEEVVTYQGVYVPEGEDGVVPRFPTWVEFPF